MKTYAIMARNDDPDTTCAIPFGGRAFHNFMAYGYVRLVSVTASNVDHAMRVFLEG